MNLRTEIYDKLDAAIRNTKLLSGSGFPIALFMLSAFNMNAQVMSLDSVLQRINRDNPMLQVYDERINAMQAYSEGATAWMAPMVGIGPYWYPYPGETIMSESEEGMIMATVEQDIPNPAKLKAKKKYMYSKARVEEQARASQFNVLRAEAKALYYKALVAQEKLSMLRESERIVTLMLRLARIRYPYNQGSLGNIYKAEARLHEIQNMMFMTNGEVEESGFRLKSLMNVPPDFSFQVDTATHVAMITSMNTGNTDLSQQRSDIKQLEQTIEVMRLNQQLQRYNAKPDFKIRFEHMQPRGSGMPKQFSVMAMVTIPIAPWAAKMYKSEVKGMAFDIAAMQKEREAKLVEAQGMIASMHAQLIRMQQQLDNYKTKIIPALRKNYETVMLAYEENREQLPAVMDSWEALNMTSLDYLEKRGAYYDMMVSYEKEMEK